MSEPWKVTVCNNEDCLREALDERGQVRDGYRLYPDLDTDEMTRFTCPRCGAAEIWGSTRKRIAKVLYEKYGKTNQR